MGNAEGLRGERAVLAGAAGWYGAAALGGGCVKGCGLERCADVALTLRHMLMIATSRFLNEIEAEKQCRCMADIQR